MHVIEIPHHAGVIADGCGSILTVCEVMAGSNAVGAAQFIRRNHPVTPYTEPECLVTANIPSARRFVVYGRQMVAAKEKPRWSGADFRETAARFGQMPFLG